MEPENIRNEKDTAPEAPVVSTKTKAIAPKKDVIRKHPYAHLALCFFVPALIMFLLYLVRGLYPLGDESVLVLDLNGQYVYFYEALRNALLGKESLL